MVLIDIDLDNSLVVDSEWWVNEKSNPDPCLISYRGQDCPPTAIAPSMGGLPSGYSYYISWYVGAERNKIKLPLGGRWLCLASLNHALYFDCVNKAENLADACARLLNKNLDKNVRDRFVTETTDYTNYANHVGKERAEVPTLYWDEIEYSRTDAQVTWEIFTVLLTKIQKLPPEVFWSIVAHSNMYTYSHPDISDWVREQNIEFNRYEAEFDIAVKELVTKATPETCPGLDWSTVSKQVRAPKWRTSMLRSCGRIWVSGVRFPWPRQIKATKPYYLMTPTLATAHTPQLLAGQPIIDTTYEFLRKKSQKKSVPRWMDKKITVKGNDFGFLLGVRDRAHSRLYPRSKADGGWLNGNCRLFCKDMIELWEKGDIVADNPGAEPILKAIIKMSFWLGVRGNFAETFRWSQNQGLKTYQDQTPKAAMTGRSTSKTCLLFPKDITKDKIGFTSRMVYHHMPDNFYQVGFDFSAQEALIIGLVCKALGDDRLYRRTTTGRLHDDNAEQWGISRSEAKAGFFAGVYGAGAARLASTIGMSMEAAQAVADGLYGRAGVCESYLRWIRRNEDSPSQIFWNRPAPIVKAGVHLLKDWFIQSTGNAMLDYVVGNLHCDGYQLSQTVHDELWILHRSKYSEPWLDPAIVDLADRMNELYHLCWITLAKRLGLPEYDVDLPCFQAEVEITNRGLKFYRHTDGILYEPVIMANPKAADRAESKLGASADWGVQTHKYAHYF